MHLDIDDEDSLSERLTDKAADLIDIAVMRTPRLSNFTDFKVLENIEGVSLRYVDSTAKFGDPDLVILPGTKNTMKDLMWLRESGLEAKVLQHAALGRPVFGICGGYQMLGQSLSDPYGVEEGGTMRGIGLLDTGTVFSQQKNRTRVSGVFNILGGVLRGLSGCPVEGYEIHMGETASSKPLTEIVDSVTGESKRDGCWKDNIYGSYVHGVFDCQATADALVKALAEMKGIDPSRVGKATGKEYKEQQYDLLADTVRAHMDMKKIYEILEEGI